MCNTPLSNSWSLVDIDKIMHLHYLHITTVSVQKKNSKLKWGKMLFMKNATLCS